MTISISPNIPIEYITPQRKRTPRYIAFTDASLRSFDNSPRACHSYCIYSGTYEKLDDFVAGNVFFSNCTDNNVAELFSVHVLLDYCIHHSLENIDIYTDSSFVMSDIFKECMTHEQLIIQHKLEKLHANIMWHSREQNTIADSACRSGNVNYFATPTITECNPDFYNFLMSTEKTTQYLPVSNQSVMKLAPVMSTALETTVPNVVTSDEIFEKIPNPASTIVESDAQGNSNQSTYLMLTTYVERYLTQNPHVNERNFYIPENQNSLTVSNLTVDELQTLTSYYYTNVKREHRKPIQALLNWLEELVLPNTKKSRIYGVYTYILAVHSVEELQARKIITT